VARLVDVAISDRFARIGSEAKASQLVEKAGGDIALIQVALFLAPISQGFLLMWRRVACRRHSLSGSAPPANAFTAVENETR
jgi:hypothetical protein